MKLLDFNTQVDSEKFKIEFDDEPREIDQTRLNTFTIDVYVEFYITHVSEKNQFLIKSLIEDFIEYCKDKIEQSNEDQLVHLIYSKSV